MQLEEVTVGSRGRILEYVQSNPGAHLREIARGLGLPLGTALYHLDFLVAREVLDIRRDGRYKRFFVRSQIGRREKELLSALRHDVPRGIVRALLRHGHGTQRQLAAEMSVSRSTLSFHVTRMVSEGLVLRQAGGPEHLYTLADPLLAQTILLTYSASFPTEMAVEGDPSAATDLVPAGDSEPTAVQTASDGPVEIRAH
ncbi:MAG: winged helix-turn-helix transcriptional regulator [Thermoplasmatota archaeon]